jgi:hypothetical protein
MKELPFIILRVLVMKLLMVLVKVRHPSVLIMKLLFSTLSIVLDLFKLHDVSEASVVRRKWGDDCPQSRLLENSVLQKKKYGGKGWDKKKELSKGRGGEEMEAEEEYDKRQNNGRIDGDEEQSKNSRRRMREAKGE